MGSPGEAVLIGVFFEYMIVFYFSQLDGHEELFDQIMKGDFEFTSPFWDDVSNSAKVHASVPSNKI